MGDRRLGPLYGVGVMISQVLGWLLRRRGARQSQHRHRQRCWWGRHGRGELAQWPRWRYIRRAALLLAPGCC